MHRSPAQYKARFSRPSRRSVKHTRGDDRGGVDDGIGQVRHALETAGIAESTLLFFIGDNGATTEKRAGLNGDFATAGDNGAFKGFKFSLFDGGMHVQKRGFVSWPARIRQGAWSKTNSRCRWIFLPTASAAPRAHALPQRVDGLDLVDTIANGAPSPHKSLYWSQNGQLATRRGAWKLVVNGRLFDRRADGNKPLEGEDAIWLSNLEDDPGEKRNLRRLQPTLVDELLTDLQRWRDTQPK